MELMRQLLVIRVNYKFFKNETTVILRTSQNSFYVKL